MVVRDFEREQANEMNERKRLCNWVEDNEFVDMSCFREEIIILKRHMVEIATTILASINE